MISPVTTDRNTPTVEAVPEDNAAALHRLLDAMRSDAVSQRNKGTRFERLALDFFRYDRTYADVFSWVETYSDWAKAHPELGVDGRDIGIDLVATLNDSYTNYGDTGGGGTANYYNNNKENTAVASVSPASSAAASGSSAVHATSSARFVAIQCKFYDSDARVSKKDIDSFIAASDTPWFVERFIIATNGSWTDNVCSQFNSLRVPVKLITLDVLEKSSIDWSQYLNSDQSQITQLQCQLRPYQQTALNNVLSGFLKHDRGKLIMACGTGKTFTSLRIAERQVGPHGFVLFLVPSLALLSQTLSEWKRNSEQPISAFAVCSDTRVGTGTDDSAIVSSMSELNYPATTNPKMLAQAVDYAQKQQQNEGLNEIKHGMTVIFSTYHSIDVIAQAQHHYGMADFDLVICDEAHRTTGCFEKIKITVNPNQPMATLLADADAANTAATPAETVAHKAVIVPEEPVQSRKGRRRKSKVEGMDTDASFFSFVHNNEYLKAKKRLYMTATPKIFVDNDKGDVFDAAEVYSMDDETIYGPVFHVLNFAQAVDLGCLVDYKVIILAVDYNLCPTDEATEKFSQRNDAKIIGAWKALNKYGVLNDLTDDPQPMRRAVGFAQVIEQTDRNIEKVASKRFAEVFARRVEKYQEYVSAKHHQNTTAEAETNNETEKFTPLRYVGEHIDGSMNAAEKSSKIEWLKREPEPGEGHILFNVRCLSEGVDVPALDAVIFFSPRASQVEVVQTVGRVMRRAPGKKRGYVIIPIVTNDPDNPENVFSLNPGYRTIWQVVNALQSINPDSVMVDPRLGKIDPRIQVVCVSDHVSKANQRSSDSYSGSCSGLGNNSDAGGVQGSLFEDTMTIAENIRAAMIKKLGNRKTWEMWAQDVAQICQDQVAAITNALNNDSETGHSLKESFDVFRKELSAATRVKLEDSELIEMLAQHVVVKPVLDELFRGFPFAENNPIAHAMSNMVEQFNQHGMSLSSARLKSFYDSVAFRMSNVTTLSDRQAVIVDLFDNFFKKAFPKQQEKLGIVYTPVEVVDFINHSVNDILKQEFGQSLSSPKVHILDPFTGTGTFLARMMADKDLIDDTSLHFKYMNEFHAYEIMPLAYYVASINMEAVYAERAHISPENYRPSNIVVLTDTFAATQAQVNALIPDLEENNERREQVERQPLRVIIGNPPYSVGQKSQNDNNKNTSYPKLEANIADTYAAKTGKIANKNSLYDSYIKAFRWASNQLKEYGVIAFVSNAGWLDSAAACGMRRCLHEEFSSIYIYHLKGNQRTSGEQSRKEGGKIFGAGSRAPIAITIMVKNPQATNDHKIFFGTVDDYLTREEKLNQLKELGSICKAELTQIIQDDHGDWLNQRRDDFACFIPIDGKKNNNLAVFNNFSNGIKTNRDTWSYNASSKTIADNFLRCISFYNDQVEESQKPGVKFERSNDSTKIKWDSTLLPLFERHRKSPPFNHNQIVVSLYRPFFKEWLYHDAFWINTIGQMPQLFPYAGAENLVIGMSGLAAKDFTPLMCNEIGDLHVLDSGAQFFPRYLYRKAGNNTDGADGDNELLPGLLGSLESSQDASAPTTSAAQPDEHGYIREDAIKPEAVEHFRAAYPGHAAEIDADSVFYYIYGVLNSPEYRSTYANNLQKELPRIPRVASFEDFSAFEQAGRKLADLHVNYEQVPPYRGCRIECPLAADYRVEQLRYGKIAGKTGNAAKDKSVIVYNQDITIRNIPLEVQEYVVNKKSALDWVVERCGVSQDKDSGIVNDYNDYASEIGDEKYIFNLILRVITVSLESLKIIKALPKLNIHPLDRPDK